MVLERDISTYLGERMNEVWLKSENGLLRYSPETRFVAEGRKNKAITKMYPTLRDGGNNKKYN
jgi:ligand-binding sensor domain-containing protein